MWARAALLARAHDPPFDELDVQVEEVRAPRPQPALEQLAEQRVERRRRDRPPAETADDVVHHGLEPGKGVAHVLADDPAGADGERLLEHDDPPRMGERGAHLLERVRAEALEPDGADADALLAQLVDDVLDRAEHRAEREDDGLGVLAPVATHEAPRRATERLRELGGDLRDAVERLD